MLKSVDILVVDDSIIFSQGIAVLLRQYPNYVKSVKIAHNYSDALKILATEKITILLLDLNFESQKYDGFTIAKKVKSLYFNTKVIILTQQAKIDNYEKLFNDIKVDGYLDKQLGVEETLEALNCVMNGKEYIDKNIKAMLTIGKFLDISKRQKEIIELLSKGFTQKEIAEKLHISNRTVETHIGNLTEKIGAKNSVELISIYTSYIKANRENLF